MALDITQMSRNGAPPVGGVSKMAGDRWWLEKGDDIARSLDALFSFLRAHQSARITQLVISSRLYGNLAIAGRAGISFSRIAATHSWLKERISWNLVQSAIDTVTAKMAKNKPRPLFLTSGGDYRMQRRAKLLNKFVAGVFDENHAYRDGQLVFRDGAIWGDGITHVYAENGRVKYERVLCSEMWVDELDGFYGAPRSLHRLKTIDRQVVLERAAEWLKDEPAKDREAILERIRSAQRAHPDDTQDFLADVIVVAESWHLPSGPEADDGLHAITIQDVLVWSEKWEHPWFPFARFSWSPRPYGYWSQGGAEQVQNLQIEINKTLSTIQQSLWKGATFRFLLPVGSKVVKDHITNQIGGVITYTGANPPTVITPQLVQPEIFQHLMSLWQKGFEQLGVSQLSAGGQKPAGLNAGIALREYQDIESDRFQTIGQAYENYYLDLARLTVATVRDISRGGKTYKVNVTHAGKFLQEIDWRDIDLDESDFVLQCFPVSSLPQEPAGRHQTIQEWVQAGWITPRDGRRLMNFPDLEMADNLANAEEDYLTKILEQMVDEGKETPFEAGFDDPDLARELAQEYYTRGKIQGLEEERLDLLRKFITEIDVAQRAAAQAAAAQSGTPQAVPEPPPTSGLIQNVPGVTAAQ